MPTFVGLDCGGSSTRVVAVDEKGETLFRGQGGAANLVSTEPGALARNLRRATEGCPPATAVCAAFAGLVGPESRERAETLVGGLFPDAALRIEPDYAAAHAAAPEGTDVTVIAGTGSLVCGPDATGRLVKTGVGGYLLGDEGSGYRFGRAALAHYLRHPESRSPALAAAVAREFPDGDEEVVPSLHRAPSPPALLARLLPAFVDDLHAEMDYALQAAWREETDLAATVSLHAKRHLGGRPSIGISLAGGVWSASGRFEAIFREALESAVPGVQLAVRKLTRPPVQGAVTLAKERIDGTESRNPRSTGLDRMDALEIVRLMDEEERTTLRALQGAASAIAQAAERTAEAFAKGGRIVYVGAGTSGRIATADAAEMPPTFGVAPDRFVAVIAGGSGAGVHAVEDAEDDSGAAVVALNALDLTPEDVLIGLAASGTTPFVVAAVRHARQKGLWTCGIANNDRTPLLQEAELGVFLDTGPEVLTGSTRLKAGTSQKLALNRISTAAMVLNGKVVENLMVDVKAKNEKLRTRCARIVGELSGVSVAEAREILAANGWSIRDALDKVSGVSKTVL